MKSLLLKSGIAVAALLAGLSFGDSSHAQNRWNNGFGPRNYGYSGNYWQQPRYSVARPTYYAPSYYAPSYYSSGGLVRSGYSTGAYGYSTAPVYYGYPTYYSTSYGYSGVGLGIAPTSPYYAPIGGYYRGGYGVYPRAIAW